MPAIWREAAASPGKRGSSDKLGLPDLRLLRSRSRDKPRSYGVRGVAANLGTRQFKCRSALARDLARSGSNPGKRGSSDKLGLPDLRLLRSRSRDKPRSCDVRGVAANLGTPQIKCRSEACPAICREAAANPGNEVRQINARLAILVLRPKKPRHVGGVRCCAM